MVVSKLPDMDPDSWRARSSEEVGFWEKWITSNGGAWPDGFKRKTNPDAPLANIAAEFLGDLGVPKGQNVKILDIGAGPLSYVGYKSDAWGIDLTVVDPLAEEYNRLLDEQGVTRVQRPEFGYFETAMAQFGTNQFDLVWCFNSLDHSLDPVLGLFNLLGVCKIGGGLLLSYHPNEADDGDYQGLHQWNLDLSNGDMIVSQKGQVYNLKPLLSQQRVMAVWQLENEGEPGSKGRIFIKIKKIKECNLSQALIH